MAKDLRRLQRQSLDRIVRFHQGREQSELAAAWRSMRLVESDQPSADEGAKPC